MDRDNDGDSTRSTDALVDDEHRRPGRLSLREIEGPRVVVTYELEGRSHTIGRSRTADITLDDLSVSGLHAEIHLGSTSVELVDLGSRNGTRLNGRRVGQAEIQAGDEILVGSRVLEVTAVEDVDVVLHPHDHFGEVVGRSRIMREVFGTLSELAASSLDVLLIGETGTGKEVVARSIHSESERRGGPFVVLDCGCLPPTLTESALFGHVRGAFTGAAKDQRGAFEQADGGTIFIDEVGELPLAQQVKLLRVLDRREFSRVGESTVRRTDVRVVAATHRDLRQLIEDGAFREDLYYRLARTRVELPPLRVRDDDVEILARRFLAGVGKDLVLDDAVRLRLRVHSWPGNVRELRNVVEHAAHLAKDGVVRREHLRLEEQRDRVTKFGEVLRTGQYREVHDNVDRWLLPKVLEDHAGVLTHAAEYLGMTRKGLRGRLKRLGLYGVEE